MRAVPRHLFVPEALQGRAYGDHALPIAANQTISQPFIVARMTELLELDEQQPRAGNRRGLRLSNGRARAPRRAGLRHRAHRGTGARGAGAHPNLGIYNATVKCFDGTLGWSAHAPYDGILVAAGGPEVPEPLLAQLKVGGKLVIPVGETRESQRLVRVIRTEKGYEREDHGACAFVPLIGHYGWSVRQRLEAGGSRSVRTTHLLTSGPLTSKLYFS